MDPVRGNAVSPVIVFRLPPSLKYLRPTLESGGHRNRSRFPCGALDCLDHAEPGQAVRSADQRRFLSANHRSKLLNLPHHGICNWNRDARCPDGRPPTRVSGMLPDIKPWHRERLPGTRNPVAVPIRPVIGWILVRGEFPGPWCGCAITEVDRAQQATCIAKEDDRGVLYGMTSMGFRLHRLHFHDGAAGVLQQINVVNQVHEDGPTADSRAPIVVAPG